MTQWATALRRTKAAVAERCNPEVEAWCPPLIINAWNECALPLSSEAQAQVRLANS